MDKETKGNWIVVLPIIALVIFFCFWVLSMTIG